MEGAWGSMGGAESGKWAGSGLGVSCPGGLPLPHRAPSPAPSDLALRNCLLTSDLTVRIGDYGLAHSNYKVGLPAWWGRGRWGRPDPPA